MRKKKRKNPQQIKVLGIRNDNHSILHTTVNFPEGRGLTNLNLTALTDFSLLLLLSPEMFYQEYNSHF